MSTSSHNASDLSSIYFSPINDSPTINIGNIQVQASQHGRGLFATKDIKVGDLLFIATPHADAAVETVFRHGTANVAEAAEVTLVDCIVQEQTENISLRQVLAYLEKDTMPSAGNDDDLLKLLAGAGSPLDDEAFEILSRERIVQVVRRNAFGPDFATFDSVQANWERETEPYLPQRLLSLYALPAMINHSCLPNAVRVFCGKQMIVHACRPIPQGAEITWSYIPLIQPKRRHLLESTHGFVCQCERCEAETLIDFPKTAPSVQSLEDWIQTLPTNEVKRYARVCYLTVYLNELNQSESQPDAATWIPLGMQLHLALAACHNASTEHLSILHFLYELEKDPKKRSFWADQLRRSVMTRYGAMGNDIEAVRRMLQHTRIVLRQRNGLLRIEQMGGNPFI